ncbi:DUF4442 domain-containing protein [Micromonospora sp. NPDC006766]|uniref:DUF4442 domain-containing protein n=1 Tax=Micromonospora sp. NPDC006766 TaxID=3154778 RepID=UPI0033DCE983
MSVDSRQVAVGLLAAVPFARTLDIEFVEVAPEAEGGVRAVVRLPDNPEHRNHVGGPHAGAMFTLGETASGAVVLAELDAGQRPEFPVEVEIGTEDGTTTSVMTVTWTLRPNR